MNENKINQKNQHYEITTAEFCISHFSDSYLGAIISLCQDRRGIQHNLRNLDQNRIIVQYKLPLNEIVVDFYDHLKSVSSGYATFDYEDIGFEPSSLVKVVIISMCILFNFPLTQRFIQTENSYW